MENVEYFKYLGSMTASDTRCTYKIKSKFAMSKSALNKKQAVFTSELDLNLRKNLVKCYILSIAVSGVDIRTLPKVDQNYL
jgi:hypothetical protein